MQLTKDDEMKLGLWLDQAGVKACPACQKKLGAGSLQTLGFATVMPCDRTAAGMSLGMGEVPAVQVACTSCGYLMLFAAKKVGLTS